LGGDGGFEADEPTAQGVELALDLLEKMGVSGELTYLASKDGSSGGVS
jgi:hypothetical protein